MAPIRKAVFPAAGLGTRFLPATKCIPKEMLPLVDRPIIQWGVEEAAAAGLEEIILISSRGKASMEDHFDRHPELEAELETRNKKQTLEALRRISQLARIVSVRQGEPLGLGHAVLSARHAVGNEPFAVVLTDDIIRAAKPCLTQLVEVFEARHASVICVEEVPEQAVSSYGIVDGEPAGPGLLKLKGLVEKPSPAQAPSRLAIIGRYVLTPGIFDELETQEPGAGGEIQLTDAIARLARREEVYALTLDGERFDVGTPAGFIKASVSLALDVPDLAPEIRRVLQSLGD